MVLTRGNKLRYNGAKRSRPMKINSKILSIPPYISSTWENIASLHIELRNGHRILIVTLHNGSNLEIPGLEEEAIKKIFETHTQFLEESTSYEEGSELVFGMPPGMESMQNMMQHNPEQSDAPPIPAEVLEKISNVSNALGIDLSEQAVPEAEPNCNCMYCQVARAIAGQPAHVEREVIEEVVSDDDLKFKEWDISQVDDKRYDVINPLNSEEHYQVFLGNPIGCTCGKKDCEHITAVLKS